MIKSERSYSTGSIEKIDLKLASETHDIAGYGAVYNRVDRGNDIITPGAFDESLKTVRPQMLYQHDQSKVLGVWDEYFSDEYGLRVSGRINGEKALGIEVASDIKMGSLDSLSIGYRVTERSFEGDVRLIHKAELLEVSVVAIAMQPLARLDAKAAAELTDRDIESLLMQDAGLSRTVARNLMRNGVEGLRTKQDAGSDLSELVELISARTKLKHNGGRNG